MPDSRSHRRADDDMDYSHLREDSREGATERWVKWLAGLAFVLAVSLGSFVMDSRVRLTKLETAQEIFTRDRIDIDRQIVATLQRLTDQHAAMIETQNRLLDEVARAAGNGARRYEPSRMFDK